MLGLTTLALAGIPLILPKLGDPGSNPLRMWGPTAFYTGFLMSVGSGLVKRMRWAAWLSFGYSLIMVFAYFLVLGFLDASKPNGREGSGAFEGGRTVGGCCPVLFHGILIVASWKAAIANPPPEIDEPPRTDLFDDAQPGMPYGVHKPAEVTPRPLFGRFFMLAGLLLILCGGGAFALSFFVDSDAAAETKGEWRRFEYPKYGFAIEAPGLLRLETLPQKEQLNFNHHYSLVLDHHTFDVIHYQLSPRYEVHEEGVEHDIDGLIRDIKGQTTGRESLSVQGQPGLRYDVKLPTGRIAVILAVYTTTDVWIVMAEQPERSDSNAAERFVAGFELLD